MAPITTKELHLFYRSDRELFCRLICNLNLNITRSLLIMVLWLWLEYTGYPNIISTMMQLTDSMLMSLSKEAIMCLDTLGALQNPVVPNDGGLPLTKILVQKHISLDLFIMRRYTAIAGLGVSSTTPFVVPGFPHPLFSDFTVPQGVEDFDVLNPRIWTNKKPNDDVTEQDKTMFLTFSRDFPVSEDEMIYLFRRSYGQNSVEEIVMVNNFEANHQPMFAKMIMDGVSLVDQILKGNRLTKLRINGKDIWARKYERRV
ncbi:hypothetical protein PIB30_086462 [Stylosanthes scabra]|uniref:Uncharacterized protein n=1 Tax=Stylosanthes scabra TaxID=79078 RepID=A0ABU6URZ2_9FABA|nr:hypothetical protein [Stylosanthes scabra]